MKISGIRGSLGILFLSFAFLVVISVGVTFWGLEAQKKDALVINLAGRQRMLVQQMTRQALGIERQGSEGMAQALRESMDTFEQTLHALRFGGLAPYWLGTSAELPPTRDPVILAQLEQLERDWGALRASLELLLVEEAAGPGFEAALRSVEESSPALVDQADRVVRLYEAAASNKVGWLRWVQAAFLIGALLLLGVGGLVTHRLVIRPLFSLSQVTRRIGAGNLSTPVDVAAPQEIAELGGVLESMRSQLEASRRELIAWTERLEDRVVSRTQELEALNTVSREISSRLEPAHVLRTVTEKTRQLLDCEVAFLCLLDGEGRMLKLQAASGPVEAAQRTSSIVQDTLAGQVLAGDQALRCAVHGCQGFCEIIALPYRASHLAAPLRVGERVIGALCVGSSRQGHFSDEALDLLTRLANAAAVALENARLYEQAERSAALEERQRIAADMHDGLAQTLSYLRMAVDQAHDQAEAGDLEQVLQAVLRGRQALDQADSDVRRAIASLQEDIPLYASLQEHLAGLAGEFCSQGSVVEWVSQVRAPLVLPHQETEQVLRVVREALLNARTHSGAGRIVVRLQHGNGRAVVSVEDDGQGFDPEAPVPREEGRPHFGLTIMRARAARIGGQVEIHSAPGAGTRVTVSWPVVTGSLPQETAERSAG